VCLILCGILLGEIYGICFTIDVIMSVIQCYVMSLC